MREDTKLGIQWFFSADRIRNTIESQHHLEDIVGITTKDKHFFVSIGSDELATDFIQNYSDNLTAEEKGYVYNYSLGRFQEVF